MQFNNLQSNNTYNASFAPNPAAANQQQSSNPQTRPVPPLGSAADLSNNPAARNLQTYNTISTPQGPTDPWNAPEYQPIKPGEPYMQKLADEAANTKKVELLLKHAQEYEELGELQDAEGEYAKTLKYTENAEHYKLYATYLKKISALLQDETEASVYKEKAARAFYYLGDLYQKQGTLQEAQAAYQASCDLAPYETSLQALVDVARHLGEATELATALETLADFYEQKRSITLAIDSLEEAFQAVKSAKILEKLGALYIQEVRPDAHSKVDETHIRLFELQISQDPKNIGLYRKYAWFLKDIGKRNEARAVKERIDKLLQTLQQKVVKQKTKIGGLRKQVEFLNRQAILNRQDIHLDFSYSSAIQDADIIPLLMHNPYAQSLNLAGCEHLTDAVLYLLSDGFENLQELNLRGCKGVTEAGLDAIAENASKLKCLTLDHCPGTTIKLLHKLNAKGIAFTIEGVAFKKNVLDLSQRKGDLTDEELLQALKENPEITELKLTDCSKITDAGLAPLKNFQWLTSLDLHNCSQIPDAGLQHLTGLTQLTLLYLSQCKKLTDAGLQHLTGLTQLRSLSWSGCNQITDEGLRHLSGFSQLTTLYLRWCHQITDEGLRHLSGLSQLRSLYLRSCNQITDGGLLHLSGLSQLQTLELYSCDKVTQQAKENLRRQIPNLKIKD